MPLPKEERYTLADVLTWDEQERAELIDGALVMMAPPSRIHQKISAELGRQLGNYLEGKKCEVYAAPFAVRLFEKAGDRPEDVDTLCDRTTHYAEAWKPQAEKLWSESHPHKAE